VDAPQSPRGEESGNESVLSASASKRQSIDIQKKQEVITWIANEGGGVASRAAAHFQALGWTLDPGMFRRWWRQKDEIMAQDATKKRVKGGGRKRLSLDVVPETVRLLDKTEVLSGACLLINRRPVAPNPHRLLTFTPLQVQLRRRQTRNTRSRRPQQQRAQRPPQSPIRSLGLPSDSARRPARQQQLQLLQRQQ
jgi:hypothetical protein